MAALRRTRLLEAGVPTAGVAALLDSVGAAAASAEGLEPYLDIHEVLRRCLDAAGVEEVETETVRRALSVAAAGMVPVLPGAAEFLRAVRALGLRCHILSNAFVRTGAE